MHANGMDAGVGTGSGSTRRRVFGGSELAKR